MTHHVSYMTDQRHHRFIHRNDRDELGHYLFPRWKRWWWWLDWKAEAGGLLWKTLIEAVVIVLITVLSALAILVFFWLYADTVSGEQVGQFVLSDILLKG